MIDMNSSQVKEVIAGVETPPSAIYPVDKGRASIDVDVG